MDNDYHLNKTEMEHYEKIAKELFKHQILLKPYAIKTIGQNQNDLQEAFGEMAKGLGFSHANKAMKARTNAINYCNAQIRVFALKTIVKVGHFDEEKILLCLPEWMQEMNRHFNLTSRVLKCLKSLRDNKKKKKSTVHFSLGLLDAVEKAVQKTHTAAEACDLLHSADALKEHSKILKLPLESLHSLWTNIYKQAVYKCYQLIQAGDCKTKLLKLAQLTAFELKVLDLGLLYDTKMHIIDKFSFVIRNQLHVCMLLFKLMASAQEKCKKYFKNGAQRGTSIHTNKCTGNEQSLLQSQESLPINVDNGLIENKMEDLDNKLITDQESLLVWSLILKELIRRNCDTTLVLQQKRWYEMKLEARNIMKTVNTPEGSSPHPLLLAMVKRFPYIVTEEMPSWWELVSGNKIFFESDIMKLPMEYRMLDLELDKEDEINEKHLIDGLYEWSDDEVDIVETVSAAKDDMKTSINSNITKETKVIDETRTESKKPTLKEIMDRIDPTKASVKIEIEDDDVVDVDRIDPIQIDKRKECELMNRKEYRVVKKHFVHFNDTKARPNRGSLIKYDDEDSDSSDSVSLSCITDKGTAEDITFGNDCSEESSDEEPTIDEKLLQIPVVKIHKLDEKWSRLECSQNNTINYNLFELKHYEIPTHNKSDTIQYALCKNLLEVEQNIKLYQQKKYLSTRRKSLTKTLQLPPLPETFWTARNIQLLEECKPCKIIIYNGYRAPKKVELNDMDGVREINKTILTAQVAPMQNAKLFSNNVTKPQESNKTAVDETQQNKNETPEKQIAVNINNHENSEMSDKQTTDNKSNCDNGEISEKEITENEDNANNNEPDGTMLRRLLQSIVSKGVKMPETTSKTSQRPSCMKPLELCEVNAQINKDLKHITNTLLQNNCDPQSRKCEKKKRNKSAKVSKSVNETDSIAEWDRQKKQTQKYFNFNSLANKTEFVTEPECYIEHRKNMMAIFEPRNRPKSLNEISKLDNSNKNNLPTNTQRVNPPNPTVTENPYPIQKLLLKKNSTITINPTTVPQYINLVQTPLPLPIMAPTIQSNDGSTNILKILPSVPLSIQQMEIGGHLTDKRTEHFRINPTEPPPLHPIVPPSIAPTSIGPANNLNNFYIVNVRNRIDAERPMEPILPIIQTPGVWFQGNTGNVTSSIVYNDMLQEKEKLNKMALLTNIIIVQQTQTTKRVVPSDGGTDSVVPFKRPKQIIEKSNSDVQDNIQSDLNKKLYTAYNLAP